jgi:hypothetical protein
MTTLLTVGSGATVLVTAVFSSPAVGVVSRGTVGCTEGDSSISESGKAVGFEDTSVKGTVGGGATELFGAAVAPGSRTVDVPLVIS